MRFLSVLLFHFLPHFLCASNIACYLCYCLHSGNFSNCYCFLTVMLFNFHLTSSLLAITVVFFVTAYFISHFTVSSFCNIVSFLSSLRACNVGGFLSCCLHSGNFTNLPCMLREISLHFYLTSEVLVILLEFFMLLPYCNFSNMHCFFSVIILISYYISLELKILLVFMLSLPFSQFLNLPWLPSVILLHFLSGSLLLLSFLQYFEFTAFLISKVVSFLSSLS